jgi:hypothetical protein
LFLKYHKEKKRIIQRKEAKRIEEIKNEKD